jgi:hypothetical protein
VRLYKKLFFTIRTRISPSDKVDYRCEHRAFVLVRTGLRPWPDGEHPRSLSFAISTGDIAEVRNITEPKPQSETRVYDYIRAHPSQIAVF